MKLLRLCSNTLLSIDDIADQVVESGGGAVLFITTILLSMAYTMGEEFHLLSVFFL
ncbi:hypothetical protein TUM3792_44550 [Shewanella sp. MBTL60-007]|nr:hypothetical protein TUM3792_44550 [Shewanella sp. MBTL60-007]